ncbi:MAG: cytidylyltransferase domain-containing protein [Alistipes shahii]|uniref:cytidylyltransferase domain-containing protein n=1 Tax=Alistipes shahii TaxID=328814 RepID=UPI00399CAAA7
MKTVAFVPIRLNSQRVAGKNLRSLSGSPLMCHILKTLTTVEWYRRSLCLCVDVESIRPPAALEGVRFLRRRPVASTGTPHSAG